MHKKYEKQMANDVEALGVAFTYMGRAGYEDKVEKVLTRLYEQLPEPEVEVRAGQVWRGNISSSFYTILTDPVQGYVMYRVKNSGKPDTVNAMLVKGLLNGTYTLVSEGE